MKGIAPGGYNAYGNTLILSAEALTDLIRTTRHTTAHTKTFLGKHLQYHQRVDELGSTSLVLVKSQAYPPTPP